MQGMGVRATFASAAWERSEQEELFPIEVSLCNGQKLGLEQECPRAC